MLNLEMQILSSSELWLCGQVGGDGLFQEIMNGLLDLRAQGGDMAAVAAGMRLGHIPAGSTDAVAYTINGTRSQLTAALHIALGDRSAAPTGLCCPFFALTQTCWLAHHVFLQASHYYLIKHQVTLSRSKVVTITVLSQFGYRSSI